MRRSRSLRLPDRAGALAGAAFGVIALSASFAIAGGDFPLVAVLLLLVAAPFLTALALRDPYVFPYCLYVALVPFDNLLRIGPGGTLTKLVGFVSALAIAGIIARERRAVPLPATVYVAFAYAVWTVASIVWASNTAAAITDAQTIFGLVIMYAILASAPIGERDLRIVCAAIIVSGVAASLYGITVFHNLQTDTTATERLVITLSGRSIDPNDFANALLPALALSAAGLTHARSVVSGAAMLAAIAVLGAGIIVSGSREAVLGAGAVALVIVLFSRRRVLAVLLAVPALAALAFALPSVGARWTDAIASGGAGRTSIWQVDVAAWLQHPIIGWGAGSGTIAYDANLLRVAPRLFYGWSRPPHNLPLHALVDLGIIGFVLIAGAYLLTFRQFRGIPLHDPMHDLRVGLTASLVALGVVSLFIDMGSAKYLWIVIAAAAQLRSIVLMRAAVAEALAVYEPPDHAMSQYPAPVASRT